MDLSDAYLSLCCYFSTFAYDLTFALQNIFKSFCISIFISGDMFNNRGSPSFVTLLYSYRKNIGLRPTYSKKYMYIYIDIWSEVKITWLFPTLCNPMDYTVHGILQARILEWVTFPFSRGSSQPRDQTQVSCIAGGFFTSWAKGKSI